MTAEVRPDRDKLFEKIDMIELCSQFDLNIHEDQLHNPLIINLMMKKKTKLLVGTVTMAFGNSTGRFMSQKIFAMTSSILITLPLLLVTLESKEQ